MAATAPASSTVMALPRRVIPQGYGVAHGVVEGSRQDDAAPVVFGNYIE